MAISLSNTDHLLRKRDSMSIISGNMYLLLSILMFGTRLFDQILYVCACRCLSLIPLCAANTDHLFWKRACMSIISCYMYWHLSLLMFRVRLWDQILSDVSYITIMFGVKFLNFFFKKKTTTNNHWVTHVVNFIHRVHYILKNNMVTLYSVVLMTY